MNDNQRNDVSVGSINGLDSAGSFLLGPPDVNSPRPRKESLAGRIVGIIVTVILLLAIVISLFYAIFIHPINKLKIRLLFTDNFTIVLEERKSPTQNKPSSKITMMIDDDLLAIGDGSVFNTAYFKIKNGKLYEYNGSWSNPVWEPSSDEEEAGNNVLLVRRNYKRVSGQLGLWEIKDGVDTGDMLNVQFRHKGGKFIFTWSEDGTYYTMTINKIGRTKVKVGRY